jgi:hypothetical protein
MISKGLPVGYCLDPDVIATRMFLTRRRCRCAATAGHSLTDETVAENTDVSREKTAKGLAFWPCWEFTRAIWELGRGHEPTELASDHVHVEDSNEQIQQGSGLTACTRDS